MHEESREMQKEWVGDRASTRTHVLIQIMEKKKLSGCVWRRLSAQRQCWPGRGSGSSQSQKTRAEGSACASDHPCDLT